MQGHSASGSHFTHFCGCVSAAASWMDSRIFRLHIRIHFFLGVVMHCHRLPKEVAFKKCGDKALRDMVSRHGVG